jgi:hypothetical protein
MQSKNPLIVRTPGQAASSIGDRMGDMRTWLDRNKVELSGFRLVTLSAGNVAFDAQFRDVGQAAMFRTVFGSSPARRLSWWHRRAA